MDVWTWMLLLGLCVFGFNQCSYIAITQCENKGDYSSSLWFGSVFGAIISAFIGGRIMVKLYKLAQKDVDEWEKLRIES